jgi:DNA-binding GntR family transcriptional regulator
MTDTGTTAHASDTDALIRRWRAQGNRSEQIAPELAAKITGSQMRTWDELPSPAALAGEYDVSQRTIARAKSLLADHDFLVRANGRYYIA